jgi:C1A family cysteine protease
MDYCVNFKKSIDDSRDYIFSNNDNIDLPDVLDYKTDLMPVRDQGSQGTCYAQSAACMKEWQEKRDYGFDEYFSPQFFYNNRFNKYDTDTTNDDGMYGRDVMKLLQYTGICKEAEYPYGKIEHRDNINKDLYITAKNHIIKSYGRIYTLDNLKKSLYLNGPCLIGVPVYNYTDQIWLKKPGDSFLGGHAMTIVGYNKEGFIIRNSWSEYWGNNGYAIYKYEDWGAHWEIWTTIDNISKKPDDEVNDDESDEVNDDESDEVNDDESDEVNDDESNEVNDDESNNESACSKCYKGLMKIFYL